MAFLDSSYHAFGLDIGDRSVKAVELRLNRLVLGQPRLELRAWNELHVPEGIFSPGKVEKPEAAVSLLRSLVRTAKPHPIRTRSVIASLPETTTFVKTIEIPKVGPEHVPEEIAREAAEQIPLPLSEATLDWQLLPPLDENAPRLRAIVAAAPVALVENFSQALESAGFTPLSVEIEAIAIVRGLLLDETIPADYAIAILDLGASRSNLVIFDHGTIQMSTSIPFSGNAVTERVAERLKTTWNEAEKMKLICGLDPARCEDRLRPIVGTLLQDLIRQIRTVFRAYREEYPGGHPVNLVLLAGGSANTFRIDTFLAQKLLLKVRKGDPLRGFAVHGSFPVARAPSFTTAIGLARRAARFIPSEASGNTDIL